MVEFELFFSHFLSLEKKFSIRLASLPFFSSSFFLLSGGRQGSLVERERERESRGLHKR